MTDLDVDGLCRRLSTTLSIPAQNPVRKEIVRARFRAALDSRQRALARSGAARRVLEPVVVGGFSLIYLLALMYDVLLWR